jgi:hypothetical protein
MLSNKSIVLTSVTALGAALLVLTQTAGSREDQQSYKLDGSWIITVPGTPLVWNGVFAPSDPSGRKAAVYGSVLVRIPADLVDPKVPYTDSSSDYVGEVVMTGHDTAKLILVGHGIQKVAPSLTYPFWERVAFAWVAKGELKFKAPGEIDCTFTLTDYPVGEDGLPDTSQPSLFSTQGAGKMVRVSF